MQPTDTTETHYDGRTIFYHWTIAALVVVQWVEGQLIGYMPRGPLRTDVWSLHIVVGVVLGVLLIGRIVWRLTRGRRLPPSDGPLLEMGAKAAHYALYALLIAVVILGIVVTWGMGFPLFNVLHIPLLDPQNPKLGSGLVGWHGMVANWILIVACVHAAAALFHHYVWRDGVLARMLPWAERPVASRTSAAERGDFSPAERAPRA